jgi:Phage integrase, N-terminal SAM-like domain
VSALAPIVQMFFTERLLQQRGASPHTVAAYRDTFRLLLAFAHSRTGKAPCELDLADLDAPLVGAFLDYLESERHNGVRTRNARLAAVHSLFRFAALRHPEHEMFLRVGPKDPERALMYVSTPNGSRNPNGVNLHVVDISDVPSGGEAYPVAEGTWNHLSIHQRPPWDFIRCGPRTTEPGRISLTPQAFT